MENLKMIKTYEVDKLEEDDGGVHFENLPLPLQEELKSLGCVNCECELDPDGKDIVYVVLRGGDIKWWHYDNQFYKDRTRCYEVK